MIVPQFIRFYQGYTVDAVMNEYAVTFFSLVNSMYRLKADESLDRIMEASVPHMSESDSRDILARLKEGSKGISGIVEQIKRIKK